MSIEEKFAKQLKFKLDDADMAFKDERIMTCEIVETIKNLKNKNLNIDKLIEECHKIGLNACFPEQAKERHIKSHKEERLIFFN